jgi:hypothetical protein
MDGDNAGPLSCVYPARAIPYENVSKPFKIIGREEGRDEKKFETEFETLADAAKYIQERWQGPEYCTHEWPQGFHTDYSTYECVGFTLKEIADRKWESEWQSFEIRFKPEFCM